MEIHKATLQLSTIEICPVQFQESINNLNYPAICKGQLVNTDNTSQMKTL